MALAEPNTESQQSPAIGFVRAIRREHFMLASGAYRDVRVVVRVPKGNSARQLLRERRVIGAGAGQLGDDHGRRGRDAISPPSTALPSARPAARSRSCATAT